MHVRFGVYALALGLILALASTTVAQDVTATAEAAAQELTATAEATEAAQDAAAQAATRCAAGPVASDAPVIKIGATVSDTGSLAHEGGDTHNGYLLWQAWVNQEGGGIDVAGVCHRAEITFYDDQSDAKQVTALTHLLIEKDGVSFILGPYSTGLTAAGIAVTGPAGVIMVEGEGASESLFAHGDRNLFGVLTPASQYTRSGIALAAALGAKTAVIAHEDEPFSKSVAAGAEQWLADHHIEVLARETYVSKVTNVDGLVTEFNGLDPDIFIGIGHYNDALLFVKTAKAQGFSPRALLMTVGPSDPAFVRDLGADADDIWGSSQWASSLAYRDSIFGSAADYAARYEQQFGVAPSYQAASATAAALTLQLGIEAAGSTDTAAVSAALHALNVNTFYGPIAFDESGKNISKPMVTTQVQDGQIVVIAPEAAAVAQAIWP